MKGQFFVRPPPAIFQAEAKKRHARVVEEIRRHDHAYYVLAQPVISDQEYDRLYHELLDLEKEFPDLATPDSPSHRVGGAPLSNSSLSGTLCR